MKINPIISWWVTPKLPYHDVFAKHNFLTQWIIHPIKRRLAKKYLEYLRKKKKITVIGITGSAGKTTTKEMLVSVLSLDGQTIYSEKNIDSVYNIPNTILKCRVNTKYLVLEMGVEYPGEMDYYLWLVKPDIGIITNIYPTHTEFFGDIDGVFEEKSKLANGLTKGGVIFLNSDDQKLVRLGKTLGGKARYFDSDVNPIRSNENAAKAVAKELGIDSKIIEKGISNYQNPDHRFQIIKHKSGAMIFDDSYNSNPWAAIASLKYFNKISKGKKIAVLGDMLELGTYNEEGHRLLGKEVAKSGFDTVIGVGNSSKFIIDEVKKESPLTKTYIFHSVDETFDTVLAQLFSGSSVLIKGSRSIRLDKLVDYLTKKKGYN